MPRRLSSCAATFPAIRGMPTICEGICREAYKIICREAEMKKMERILHAGRVFGGASPALPPLRPGSGSSIIGGSFMNFRRFRRCPLTLIAVCAGTGGCGRRIFGATAARTLHPERPLRCCCVGSVFALPIHRCRPRMREATFCGPMRSARGGLTLTGSGATPMMSMH